MANSGCIGVEGRTSPPVRNAYSGNLFVPRGYQGSEPKHGITVLIDKTDEAQMTFLKKLGADLKACVKLQWTDKGKPVPLQAQTLIGNLDSPIKDGDKTVNSLGRMEKEKYPEYEGHYYIRVYSKAKPNIRSKNNEEILDTNVLYSGCWVRVQVNAYAYPTGVTIGLNGVQFWRDDSNIGGAGRPNNEDMFSADDGHDDPDNYGPAVSQALNAADMSDADIFAQSTDNAPQEASIF